MINKERVLKTARRVVQQQNLPIKIRGVEELPEAVAIYFLAEKRVPLKNLARDLEFELNLPVKLERISKGEIGKIGKTDVLGNLGCCATFSSHCLFKNKYGCGYGFENGVNSVSASTASAEKSHQTPKTPQKAKKKKRKVVRRLVIK